MEYLILRLALCLVLPAISDSLTEVVRQNDPDTGPIGIVLGMLDLIS